MPFSPATFEVLKAVAEAYNDILKAQIQSITAPPNPTDATRMILSLKDGAFIGVTFKNPNDSSTVNPLNFTSTGKIYLYYEYDLSLSELGSLENLFQSKGLSPQFRGWDYAAICWRQIEHEGRPVPKVENVIARTAEFTEDDHSTSKQSSTVKLPSPTPNTESPPHTSDASRHARGFSLEALELIPDLLNLTQLSWYKGAKVIFTGDAAVSIENLLPAQGIDFVNLRLLKICPPMESTKAYKPSTLDSILKRVDFSKNVPSTLLGGKSVEVRLFKVTRPMKANSLNDIKIEFYGEWPEGYYSVFMPQARHKMVVEVTGNGVSREEATFELHFSLRNDESVLSIKTIRSAVGKA